MALQNSDLFYVQRGANGYQMQASALNDYIAANSGLLNYKGSVNCTLAVGSQLTTNPPKLAVRDTHTKEPDISLKKGITTLEDKPHKIGMKAINNIIALTTCKPKLSTILAKFIASS